LRGSGYLIAPGRVLTAAHVVTGASVIRVRLDVGQDTEIDVQAESWWADPAGHESTDLAVVTIPEDVTGSRTFEPTRFGRISDCTAVLKVNAFGFPLFKLRYNPANAGQGRGFRDFEQAIGHVPVAANRRQGTLAVYLDDPPPRQAPTGEPSPWEGMSGGPVLAAGRIVGIVAEHHPSEGAGRLTARRIDRAYDELSAPDLSRLVRLLGLAPAPDGLPDVVPREQAQLVRSAYLAQVRDIAPDSLIGRGDELADWAEFCAGPDCYAWWQAGPWAGKSALASWFVLHPPVGVDVVSFFITGRLIGQADSDAFLNAMIEQLNSSRPASEGVPVVAGARAGEWWDLLASAAGEAEERGRRLVVVVDGLDEDEAGATPLRGRPSIASLLPRRPPSGARLIVTSRPDPGLPDDVRPDHPLRACTPHRLSVSPVAENIELLAKQELRELLAGDQIALDVIGYIAGSGGGLTRSDLCVLTGASPHNLDPVLRGVFGRSLYARASTDPRDPQANPATRVYLFAHETLRATAEEQLGGELARYREKVHEWISSYARADWPGITPGYAIRGYLRLLAATADVMRLSALARDPRRHAFLLDATGSDYVALTEIGTAQSLIADQGAPDLEALCELAAYRLAILIRNESIPDDLPIAWAWLGRLDHAEALVRTMADPDDQVRALSDLATAIAQAGDPDRAEALARTITNPDDQAEALASLAIAVAQAGDPDRAARLAADAEALARTITDPDRQAWALSYLVTAIAEAGDLDHAEALARTITDPDRQAEALASLATASAQAGDPDSAARLAADAEALARTITDANRQARVLTNLATASAQAGDLDRAARLATDAEALARTITNPDDQAWRLSLLVTAIAQAGDPDRAEALARTITNPDRQTSALINLASVMAQAGDLDRAEALARTMADPDDQAWILALLVTALAETGDLDRAEALARTITIPFRQAEGLASLVTAIAQAGDLDRAEALARTITEPDRRAEGLTNLATVMAQAGDPDRASRLAADAEALARTITDPDDQAEALSDLATAIAQAGDPDRAEALARTITDPNDQAWALASMVTAVAQAGDPDRAEALARTFTDPFLQAWALGLVIAQTGDPDGASRLATDAEALARTITDHDNQVQALINLAAAAAQAGDLDRASRLATDAEALARTITNPDYQARVLVSLVTVIAAAGDPDRAEALARTITEPDAQAWALASMITAVAQAGDPDRASRLATDAEALARTITGHDYQARTLANVAIMIARAGDPDRAETLARTITSPYRQAEGLASLVTVIAQAGDPDRAEALARTITDPDRQARALNDLVTAVAQTGDTARAVRLLTMVLVMDLPGIFWIKTVSKSFPSAIGNTLAILSGIYAAGA
jgi:hypothetical protein